MGIAITDVDLAELRSLYPLCKFDVGFTGQQERFILYHLRGLSASAAATAAGYAAPGRGQELLKDQKIQAAIDLLREREFDDIRITRDKLNAMLLDAHAKAANTTEEVMAIKELGKMNGLYESDKQIQRPGVQINIGSQVQNHRQLERMNDQQLLEIAGQTLTLDPSEYSRLDDGSDR